MDPGRSPGRRSDDIFRLKGIFLRKICYTLLSQITKDKKDKRENGSHHYELSIILNVKL